MKFRALPTIDLAAGCCRANVRYFDLLFLPLLHFIAASAIRPIAWLFYPKRVPRGNLTIAAISCSTRQPERRSSRQILLPLVFGHYFAVGMWLSSFRDLALSRRTFFHSRRRLFSVRLLFCPNLLIPMAASWLAGRYLCDLLETPEPLLPAPNHFHLMLNSRSSLHMIAPGRT